MEFTSQELQEEILAELSIYFNEIMIAMFSAVSVEDLWGKIFTLHTKRCAQIRQIRGKEQQ